jgi:hypothetical protein
MTMGMIDNLKMLDMMGNEYLDTLKEERFEGDERRRKVAQEIDRIQDLRDDERCTSRFYGRTKMYNKKEEIRILIETIENKEDKKEKTKIERNKQGDIVRVAKLFYEDLWKKRDISRRKLKKLLANIKKRLSEEEKAASDKKITIAKIRAIIKKMHKKKAPGIDGIPAEFYQKYDYTHEWLLVI